MRRAQGWRVGSVFALAWTLLPVRTAMAEAPTWTVIVYVCADCPGECGFVDDVRSMLSGGLAPNQGLHVVGMIDRRQADDQSQLLGPNDGADTRFFKIEGGAQPQVDILAVDRNMGSDTALKDLLDRAIATKAKHYALLMLGHGQGLEGLCPDDEIGKEGSKGPMPVAALAKRLAEFSAARDSVNKPRLEVLFLQACFMSHLEVAAAVAPSVDRFVAAPTDAYTQSVCHAEFFKDLRGNDTPDDLAGRLVTKWRKWLSTAGPCSVLGHPGSCETTKRPFGIVASFRCADLGPVVNALGVLGAALKPKLASHAAEIRDARNAAEGYDPTTSSSTTVDTSTYRHRDIEDFAKRVADALPSVADPAHQLIDAIHACRSGISHGPDAKDGGGLTICFPHGECVPADYLALFPVAGWNDFLSEYRVRVRAEAVAIDTPSAGAIDRARVYVDVTAPSSAVELRKASGLYFMPSVRDDPQHYLGVLPVDEPTRLGARAADPVVVRYRWNGSWPVLSDARTLERFPCPVRLARWLDAARTSLLVEIPLRSTPPAGPPSDVYLTAIFERGPLGEWGAGDIISLYDPSEAAVRRADLQVGDRIQGVYLSAPLPDGSQAGSTIDAQGSIKLQTSSNLQIGFEPLPTGTYHVLFVGRDHRGNSYASRPPPLGVPEPRVTIDR